MILLVVDLFFHICMSEHEIDEFLCQTFLQTSYDPPGRNQQLTFMDKVDQLRMVHGARLREEIKQGPIKIHPEEIQPGFNVPQRPTKGLFL